MANIFDSVLEPVFSAFESVEGSIDTAAPAGMLLLGLVMGLRHAIEADHVAAVSTMMATPSGSNSSSRLRRAPLLGAMWGLGHAATLFAAGLLALVLAVNIPEKVSGRLEFGVGVMLIFLAATAITGFNASRFFRGLLGAKKGRRGHHYLHSHVHAHPEEGVVHDHGHSHSHGGHGHSHKSIIVGMVHGMAGSGALMLLVLSTIQSVPLGLAYIAIFGAGSVAGMAGMSTLIGLPFARANASAKNTARLAMALRYAAAAVAIYIGAGILYEQGVVQQVFQ